ncbi:MAG: hypothetical protein ACR2PG_00825 [Hyphomicrobiaceae bacterium]
MRHKNATLAASLLTMGLLIVGTISDAAFAQNLMCTFPTGTVYTYENKVYVPQSAEELSFEIGAIDLVRQQAALITSKGEGELKIVRAIGANHYLEVVTEGFLNITTVYEASASDGSKPAVHSRHFGLLGQPVVSQYHGTCALK